MVIWNYNGCNSFHFVSAKLFYHGFIFAFDSTERGDLELIEMGLTNDLVVSFVKSVFQACQQEEKCFSNSFRTIGNVMRLAPKFFYGREYDKLKDEMILLIIKSIESGPVKVF